MRSVPAWKHSEYEALHVNPHSGHSPSRSTDESVQRAVLCSWALARDTGLLAFQQNRDGVGRDH